MLRKIYRKYIHWPDLDRAIYKILDVLTNTYGFFAGYYFPKNFVRRWKLDMLLELYEKETADLFKKIIKPGMTVVDVGAHIGYFTRIFSRLVGRSGLVLAFEADPKNFEWLKKNTARKKNVKIFNIALTDKAGFIDFYHYEEKMGVGSVLPNVPLDLRKTKINVDSSDLDSFLEKENITRVDVIKMDIEGGESLAIKGTQRLLKKNAGLELVVEFAPAWIRASGNDPDKFLEDLRSFGFEIFAIQQNGLEKIEPAPKSYEKFIPKSSGPTPYGEFVNLYCVKNKNGSVI